MWDSAEVGPSFFETMGIPVVRGRTFTAADFAGDQRGLFVVNEAWVRRYFPNDDPLARAARHHRRRARREALGVRSEVRPMMYADGDEGTGSRERAAGPHRGRPGGDRAGDPRGHSARQSAALVGIRTMREEIDRDIAKERMVAAISAFFSVLGLLLASIGIFGVASYTVAQRTKELASAGRSAPVGGRSSANRCAKHRWSSALGLVGRHARRDRRRAVDRQPHRRPAVRAHGDRRGQHRRRGAVMVAVALAACMLPAHRATRIDPLAGIREE